MVTIDEDTYLSHIGVIRRSGRYPWGSGGDPLEVTNNRAFLDWIKDLRKQGLTDPQIAEGLKVTTNDLRAQHSISSNEERASNIVGAQRLAAKGLSNKAIGERLGEPGKPIGESTVRNWLKPGADQNTSALQATADMLRRQVDEKGVIDIGKGTELSPQLGVAPDRLKVATSILKKEGYTTFNVPVPQLATGHETNVKVLAKPGITQKEVWQDPTKIRLIDEHSEDFGNTFLGIKTPIAVSLKRVGVNYAEDGGAASDGIIYVRPDVKDVSLGGTNYAQVRVQVGPGHFLKGMAVYKDDLPEGIDVVFNTNKKRSEVGDVTEVFKPLKTKEGTDDIDTMNPFGSVLKRQILEDPNDKSSKVTSSMNLVREEGNWNDWSRTIASQVLSKQEPKVAKSQLNATLKRREEEFDEIMSLTNSTVRKKLLQEFADESDAAAVHLKTAGFPRQGWHVILPVANINPVEIYAPNFDDGETVALIRYPHGGTFEIPELRVNNSNREARKMMGGAKDAVGIHHTVAERLSGADFDGDTVLVIPNNNRQIKSTPALEGLKNFHPREAYPHYEGMKVMSNTQTEMGKISNLVTDMTIKGAPIEDVVRAVRHSMVVIDAEKHKLNHRESAKREGIKALKEKYQMQDDGKGGAATLISRAKADVWVDRRKPRPAALGGPINKETGAKEFVSDPKANYKTGKPLLTKSKGLAEADNAHDLSSGTPIEHLYAGYSNSVKSLANRARLEYVNTPRALTNKSAKETYRREVDELDAALKLAVANAPRERRANILAKAVVKAQKQENPSMDKDVYKKIKGQALTEMRARTGAKKDQIKITPAQWDAIQAGAVSDSKLTQILGHADMDIVKKHATPKTEHMMTSAKTSKAAGLLAAGHTRSEVAKQLGVSLSTLDKALYG
jgi:hypothetical protein